MAKRSTRVKSRSNNDTEGHPNVRALFPDNVGRWSPMDGEGRDSGRDQSYVRHIRAKSENQRRLLAALSEKNLIVATGPAGTGKTFLAIAKAVEALEEGRVAKIMLSRPAIEAGEKLGFLPGDIEDKLAPYLRPLYDALAERLGGKRLRSLLAEGAIEIAPVAYMRGRTLNNAVIILDEAQNCTPAQMLMFLTRLGHHSKMIVTGDDSQSDLEPGQPSGLIDALQRLRGIAEIGILRLTEKDIIRHRLVQVVVARYAEDPPQGRRRDHEPDKTSQGMQPVDGLGSSPVSG